MRRRGQRDGVARSDGRRDGLHAQRTVFEEHPHDFIPQAGVATGLSLERRNIENRERITSHLHGLIALTTVLVFFDLSLEVARARRTDAVTELRVRTLGDVRLDR